MSSSTLVHADFTITRNFSAPVHKVYQAFADTNAKERWFKGPSEDGKIEHTMDFRVGGREYNSGSFHGGVVHTFKAVYYDIVPDKRIVYAYEMYLNDQRISVSLTSIELNAQGDGTELVFHESGVFLDGLDKPENRERGSKELLAALEASMA